MQGRILIVDGVATNRISLRVKLKTAFYEVVQASTQAEAVAIARDTPPDLIIAALSLPDGGASTLCAALTRPSNVAHIPVIAIGTPSEQATRVTTLAAGVEDVLEQPLNETLLMARVRSLIRAGNAAADWQMREDTCQAVGMAEPMSHFGEQGHCMLVSADKARLQKQAIALRRTLRAKLTLASSDSVIMELTSHSTPDVFVLILSTDPDDAARELRLISALRASATARHTGIIVVQSKADPALGASALDLGADDLMTQGFDAAEMALRAKAVMRRKRMSDQLRATVRTGLQAAVFDPLTGLYNRRYAMPHLDRIASHAEKAGNSFAVMAADLDHFKRINDLYGHASGDAVLVEVAHRLRQSLRSQDMVARVGGEEFLIVMPGADPSDAQKVAQHICATISARPFIVPGSRTPVSVTISIGLALSTPNSQSCANPADLTEDLLLHADRALYDAKEHGRNQIKIDRPAA